MSRKNRICEHCNEKFHFYLSCEINPPKWQFQYCSRECWKSTKEYIEMKFAFKKIYAKLKDDSLLEEFMKIIDISEESDFKDEIPSWIYEIECEDG